MDDRQEMLVWANKKILLIEKILHQMDKRFDELRGDMNRKLTQLQWTMGIMFTVIAALMGIFNFF